MLNELYQFRLELKNQWQKYADLRAGNSGSDHGRRSVRSAEIPIIMWSRCRSDLSVNIKYSQNIDSCERLMNQAFIDIMLEELEISGMNVNRLTNKAVYLLCWLKRYQKELF